MKLFLHFIQTKQQHKKKSNSFSLILFLRDLFLVETISKKNRNIEKN